MRFLHQIETEGKLARMVITLIFVWMSAWTPYGVMCIWSMFFDSYSLTPTMGLIPLLICKISAAANVLLYGLRYFINYVDNTLPSIHRVTKFFNKVYVDCDQ